MRSTYNRDRCPVITNDGSRCSKVISNAGFALAAHNKMHLRAGELIHVTRYSWKGIALETRVIEPRDAKMLEHKGFFVTYERCVEVYEQTYGPRMAE